MWDLIVSVPDHCLSFYFIKYMYGEFLCKVLVDSNCCVLNGRQCENDNDNGFTFLSTRGNSVVDYFIVPYECYEGFKVIRPTQIYGDNLNRVESRLIPDHSIITCRFILNRFKIELDPKLHHDFFLKSDLPDIMYQTFRQTFAMMKTRFNCFEL